MSGDGAGARKAGAIRLRLYVAGESPNSVAALRNVRALLAAHPSLEVDLEILDVLEHPELGERDRVLVTPMMIRLAPAPERRVFGTLKDADAVRAVLGLEGYPLLGT